MPKSGSYASGSSLLRPALWLIAALALGAAEARAQFGPANDMFANAWELPGDSGTTNGFTCGAGLELGEPQHYYFENTNSVWFHWIPSTNGTATFDTSGSMFDTILAVYRSYGFGYTNVLMGLYPVGANDDYTNHNSLVSFYAYAGYDYYVAVLGYPGRHAYYCNYYGTNYYWTNYVDPYYGTNIMDLDGGYYLLNWNFTAYFTNVLWNTNQIQFSSATYSVAEDMPGYATIDVYYNGGASVPVTVNYAASDGTGVAGTDYLPASGTLTFGVGESNKSFLVQIIDNAMPNSNRTVNLTLSNPTGGATLGRITNAVLTIVDNETIPFRSPAGEFNFTATYYNTSENEGRPTSLSPFNDTPTVPYDTNYREVMGVIITVNRLGGSTGRVMVDWFTTNKFSMSNNFFNPFYYPIYYPIYYPYGYPYGNAFAQEYYDYMPTNGTLIFDDFQTSTNFVVPLPYPSYYLTRSTNDVVKYFNVALSNPRPALEEDPQLIRPTLGPTNQTTVGIVMINNQPMISFERFTYRLNEYGHGNTNQSRIRVDLIYPPGGPACVDVEVDTIFYTGLYILMDGSDYADDATRTYANPIYTDGTANISNLADFVPQSFTLNFGDGRTAASFYIVVNNDDVVEFNEDIFIRLFLGPQGCRKPINPYARESVVTILYDDEPAGALDREWNPAADPRTIPSYNPSPGANNVVYAVAVQPDEKQVIVGDFTAYNTITRSRIARINLDGSIDNGFNPGTGADDFIYTLALYPPDTPNTNNIGKIVIGGNFTSYDGIERYRIARVNPNGSLDTTFRPGNGANGTIWSLALQSDGKIVIVGDFTRFNGEPRKGIARLNDDGSLDLGFDSGQGADDTVWSVAVRDTPKSIFVPRSASGTEYEDVNVIETGSGQGTLIIDYNFTDPARDPDNIRVYYEGNRIFELTTNNVGQLIVPYGPGASTAVTIIMNEGIGHQGTIWRYRVSLLPIIPERTIYVGGDFRAINGQPRFGVARLRDNGFPDTTFDPGAGADKTVFSVAVQADGKLLMGGAFTDVDYRYRNGIARLNRDGTLDTAYDPGDGFDDTVFSLGLQPDGKALVGGIFSSFNHTRRVGMARLFQNGLLDTSFLDTGYNQFAGVIRRSSIDPANFVNSIVPYAHTNIDVTVTQTVTNGITNNIITTNITLNEFVMIGGSFHTLGGNNSYWVNDTNDMVWTRQDKVPRYNVARLIGGYTPGPGNVQFTFPEYRIDESSPNLTVYMERMDGRLGTLEGLVYTSNRVAQAGIDYTNTVATNVWPEYAYVAPRSVGWIEHVFFQLPIFNDELIEGDEMFDLNLIDPQASITLGGEWIPLGGARGKYHAPVTIVDNDFSKGIIGFSSPAYTTIETNGLVRINLVRTNGSNGRVSVDFYTLDGSATAGSGPPYDYASNRTTVVFGPGETNSFVDVQIWNDNNVEFDETISLILTNAAGGAKLPGGLPTSAEVATLTIVDDDFKPGRLNFSAATYSTNEGAGVARIWVTRTMGSVGSVSVQVAATNGTAIAGQDFRAVTNLLSWASGRTEPKYFDVPLYDNYRVDGSRTVNLRLLNASTNGAIGNRGTAVLTIQDDDAYGVFDFSQPSYDADENGTNVTITVVRSGGTNGTVLVDYVITDGSARRGLDYFATNGTLQFTDGEISKSFTIGLINDSLSEGLETVLLSLVNRTNATLGPCSTAVLNIIDDESSNIPAGSLDPEFDAAIGANGPIYALALQPDGKLIAGGDFTTFNHATRRRLARVYTDGSLDPLFDAGEGPNRSVLAMALQPDEKLLIAGAFTRYHGTNRSHIARLNKDGVLDNYYNPGSGADNPIHALALLPGGRVAIGGSFATFNGVSTPHIAVLGTNGMLDADFHPGTGANGTVYAIALQRDGKLVIGGDFSVVQNVPRSRIARLYPDGSLDLAFDPGAGADDTVRALAIQPDGKILVGGSFLSMGDAPRNFLARLNDDGSLDPEFLADEAGGDRDVYALALQADGKIIVAGDFTRFNSVTRNRITRLNHNGRTDPTINFGTGANDFIAALVIQPDRKIVIAGGFTIVNDEPKNYIARLHGGSLAGPGALGFSASTYVVDENAGNALITVRRFGGTTGAVAVDAIATNGTAIAGLDYSNRVETLLFPEGEVLQTFAVPIIDDQEVEGPEVVSLQLTNFVAAGIGPDRSAELIILSDDSVVSFQTENFYVNENAVSGFGTITVVRSGATNSLVSVDYLTQDGTATDGLDYMATRGSLLFAPGETMKQFFVAITNDTLVEGNETIGLILTNASANGVIGGYATATLNLVDDDLAPGELSFSSSAYTVNEYETNITITVIRTNGSSGLVSVSYFTSDGTARAGKDYGAVGDRISFDAGQTVKTFTVPIFQDYIDETNETVILTLANPGGGAVLGGTATATLTIRNTRLINGNFSFTATNYTVTESNLAVQLTVRRAFGSNGPVSVSYGTLDGTALAGQDYVAATNTISWTNGETADKTISIEILTNNVVENTETFSVILFAPTGGATLGAVTNATVTILDDDVGPGLLSFSTAGFTVNENATNALISVVRTFGHAGVNTIYFRTVDGSGTARLGIDYLSTNGPLDFLDGETNKTFSVPVLDNSIVEGNRTLDLELFNPLIPESTNGQLLTATLTILEDELPSGSVDLSFNAVANDQVYAVMLATNTGKVYVGGDFTELNGVVRGHVGRLNPNGTLDMLFDPSTNINHSVRALALPYQTNLLVGGVFTNAGGTGRSYLARLYGEGALDTNYLAEVDNFVYAIAFQSDGKTVVGGAFTGVNGELRGFLARLDANGALDPNFNPWITPDRCVRAIALQEDGRIIIGGDFTIVNNESRNHIARLEANGDLDMTFATNSAGADNTVQALAIQSDGKVLIGGLFTNVYDTASFRVARLNVDGSLDATFNSGTGANEFVSAIAVQPDGRIYLGGGFTEFNGVSCNRLVRLNPGGSIDTRINFGSGANNYISTIALQLDHKIIIGGGFTEFDGVPCRYLARLNDGDNYGSGTFVFSATNYTVVENGLQALISVRRQLGGSNTVSVDFSTADGTAQAGIHYAPTNGTLIFQPGETLKTFAVPVIDDTITNADRTVLLALNNPLGGATLGLLNTATLTIINEDEVVGFTGASFSVSENAGQARITVERTGGTVGAVTVDYAASDGTALGGVDYAAVTGTLFFTNGQAQASFDVPIYDDPFTEGDETVVLTLSGPTGSAVLGLQTAILTIMDDDFSPGTIQFSTNIFTVLEQAGSATITVQRPAGSSGAASVQYATSDGTAQAGADYAATSGVLAFADNETDKTFTIPIYDDALVEGNETINLTLSNPVGGRLGLSTATLTILADEAIFNFSATNYIVSEGVTNALITVMRTGIGTGPVSVDYLAYDGTATNLLDYTNVTGRLTFLPGDTTQTFLVPIVDDAIGEDPEFFTVVLTNAQGEAVLGPVNTATVTILDNDTSFVLDPPNYIVNEAVGNALVTVARRGSTNGTAWVSFQTSDGTAKAGATNDYLFTTMLLTFGPGMVSTNIFVPIIDDAIAEGNEFLYLNLFDPTNATLGVPSQAILTIVDNEDSLSFDTAYYYIDEGATSVVLNVIRQGVPSGPLNVQYATSDGTATSPADYAATSGALNFPVGYPVTIPITIPIVDDMLAEGDETFTVRLYNLSGGRATLISPSNVVVTILDNDVSLHLSAPTYEVNENGTNAVITVQRRGGISNTVAVGVMTVDLSPAPGVYLASDGLDYIGVTNVLIFPPGVVNQAVYIPIYDDLLIEGDEIFGVRLFDPGITNNLITLSAPTNAQVTILDNDKSIIIPSGMAITNESIVPANGRVDPGETVHVWFGLRNIGNADTVNLWATLLPTNGIAQVFNTNDPEVGFLTDSANYGVLGAGGTTVSKSYVFAVTNLPSGTHVAATFRLEDRMPGATNYLGLISFPFTLGEAATTYTNSGGITINPFGPATPYPSTITITGLVGVVTKVTVTLNNFTHTYPDDVDILLVGPTGEQALIMSDAGGGNSVGGLTITLDDNAPNPLPDGDPLTSGTFRPANYASGGYAGDTFPPPAPGPTYDNTSLAVFKDKDPNGVWSLYVYDDLAVDGGNIAGGWGLNFTFVDANIPSADVSIAIEDSQDPVLAGSYFSYTLLVTNRGPAVATNVVVTDLLPAGVNFLNCAPSQGTWTYSNQQLTWNIGNMRDCGFYVSAIVSVQVAANLPAPAILINSASVTTSTVDQNLGNNFRSLKTQVASIPPLSIIRKNGEAVIYWPAASASQFRLEATDNLAAPDWVTVDTSGQSPSGGLMAITINPATGQRFYRLQRP